MFEAIVDNLRWQSDWNGDEVGFADIDVVGLFTNNELRTDFYIDSSTGKVLEVMNWDDDEEEY